MDESDNDLYEYTLDEDTCKRLALKYTAKTMGLTWAAYYIAMYNGTHCTRPQELYDLECITAVAPWKDEVEKYHKALDAIEEARQLGDNVLRQAWLACAGLRTFQEAVSFANADYPKSIWPEYGLASMSQEKKETGLWLWRNLRNTLRAYGAIRSALKLAGQWLGANKLETILPNPKPLKEIVESLDKFARDALKKLKAQALDNPLPKYAKEIFKPIVFSKSIPNKKEMNAVKDMFDFSTFYADLQHAISELNYYYEERLPGEEPWK